MERVLPPVIRVFISSTFADMERERHEFSTVIAPKLERLCADRGVSFFGVDLRWGITREEQMSGQVLPTCLREIDNCRPFFLGILGDRYGSAAGEIPADLLQAAPWLRGMEGRSVTEVEMLYGVLQAEQGKGDCAFFLRSEALSARLFPQQEPPERREKLLRLRARIRTRRDIPVYDYDSLEEFEAGVVKAFTQWLDREFPSQERAAEARKRWYNSELLRDYMEQPEFRQFMDRYWSSGSRPLLIWGDGLRGKTTFLTGWTPPEGKKILINCGSDEAYRYWPTVAHEIIRELRAVDESVRYPTVNARESMVLAQFHGGGSGGPVFYVNDRELDSFRRGFVAWLKGLRLRERVTIIIDDLDLIRGTGSRYLNWLPAVLPKNLDLICSARGGDIRENAETLGWNTKEMPLCPDSLVPTFLDNYLGIFGKKLGPSQRETLLKTPLLQYPGYLKFMVQFLNQYGRFENLNELTAELGKQTTVRGLYHYVLSFVTREMDRDGRDVLANALALLSLTTLGVKEESCFAMTGQLCTVDALTWAEVRRALALFGITGGDTWSVQDPDLKAVAEGMAHREAVHGVLSRWFREAMDGGTVYNPAVLRRNTELAQAAVYHQTRTGDWEALCQCLADRTILKYLMVLEWKTVRVAWMTMLLNSEIHVGDKLLELVREEKRDRQVTGLAPKLVSLLGDLEQDPQLKQAVQETGLPVGSDLLRVDNERFSKDFSQVYAEMEKLRSRREHGSLLQRAAAYLRDHKESEMDPLERAYFYVLKANSELELKVLDEALETVGKLYRSAIEAMSTTHLISAALMRGQILCLKEKPREALSHLAYAKRLTLEEGNVHEYLSALNTEGMARYRMKEFREAIRLFDECIRVWDRLGNLNESVACEMNRCNAIYLAGDTQKARDEARRVCGRLRDHLDEKGYIQMVQLLSNLASYDIALKELDRAEEACREAIRLSEGKPARQYVSSAYYHLIEIYTNWNQTGRKFQVYEELLELLLQCRKYADLARAVREYVYQLSCHNYVEKAKEVDRKWQEIFDGIPNGRLYYSSGRTGVDELRMDQLGEQLVMARSEDDPRRSGELLRERATLDPDKSKAVDDLLEAVACFQKAGEPAEANGCKYIAIGTLLEMPDGGQDPRLEIIRQGLGPGDREILALWLDCAALARKGIEAGRVNDDPAYSEKMRRVAELAREAKLAQFCLLGQLDGLAHLCTEGCMVGILETVKMTIFYRTFAERLARKLLDNSDDDVSRLRREYETRWADQRLRHYEVCLAVLGQSDPEQAAGLAGNLAIIFRRRKEWEKTLKYHRMSMELYEKKEGKSWDYYIEVLNLATAYSESGLKKQSADLLRPVVTELVDRRELLPIRASAAGNLAGLLMETDPRGCREEIRACFAIEEEFFAGAGEDRDLVISLLNQVRFYTLAPDGDKAPFREKLKRARALCEKNRFSDFIPALGLLERQLEGGGNQFNRFNNFN